MSTTILSHKDYCLSKYRNESVPFLINRKLMISKQLEKPTRTSVVYSDLHGSYEKYLEWLKSGMGYFRIAISEIMGVNYSTEITEQYERLFLLVNRTRLNAIARNIEEDNDIYTTEDFFFEPVPQKFRETLDAIERMGLTRKRILEDLLKFLRLITREDEHRIIKAVPPMFLENILKLFFKTERNSYESMLQGIVDNQKVCDITISFIIKISITNMFDKHVNLGDSFDRGDGADKLLHLYQAYFGPANNTSPLHYIWGNHDILWMGAAVGNPALVMTALRISLRYNNVDFLFRYGFNLDALRNFSNKYYRETPTGKYIKEKKNLRWPIEEVTKMTKTLLVLEAKLTVLLLREVSEGNNEFEYDESLKRYAQLLKTLPTGVADNKAAWENFQKENPLFIDCYFPTLDGEDPARLTPEEETIVNDLVTQFTTLPKLQRDINWLFEKGETYRVLDNTLYYHAALPTTEFMELDDVNGIKGKDLLDFIQRDLKRISSKHKHTPQAVNIREKMFFWYLWCGKKSPFFCKNKMATLETAVFDKERSLENELTAAKEKANPYYKYIRNDEFITKVLLEFHAEKICMGHTPIKDAQQSILTDNNRAFIIDGGASSAYGDKGAVLINSPDYTYVTLHAPLEELKKAETEDRLPNLTIIPLEEKKNLKLRHVDAGYFLRRELQAIDELLAQKLDQYCAEYFY